MKKQRKIDKKARGLLQDQIKDHDKGRCRCDLTDGGYGLCYAGQFLEGVVSSEGVIKDLGKEIGKQRRDEQ